MEPKLVVVALLYAFSRLCYSQGLPTVDLGYEIHRAISLDATGQFYNFSNIRFAQPPVGDLRWAAPEPPTGRNLVVQNGSIGRICPQANPTWLTLGFANLPNVVAGNASDFNVSLAEQQLQAAPPGAVPFDSFRNGKLPPQDPRTTEDCLFLDVVVPKSIFDKVNNGTLKPGQQRGAPVMAWIYGGGYTIGEKSSGNDVHGMMKTASQMDGLVFVAMNYRLGALGFLSGPTLQAAGGVSNAGLLDQRLALEWIQKYIHLFGGDPDRVTITGESAGGGSIEFQITAYGGLKPAPFQRAMPQSPGFIPSTSTFLQENTTQTFLKMINASSIAEARKVSSDVLIKANAMQIATSNWGTFTYGPVVDGTFAPALPGLLLNAGSSAPNISVFNSHCGNEGALFTPPYLKTEEDVDAWFQISYPEAVDEVREYVLTTLYPPVYDDATNETHPYTSLLERVYLMISESAFLCNIDYTNRAYGQSTSNGSSKSYTYAFEIGPSFHGCDAGYNFYTGQPTNATTGMFASYAQQLQDYQVRFITTGDPNGPGLPVWPAERAGNASAKLLTPKGWSTVPDPTRNHRCEWWQKGLAS
ncbi:hypothetical protein AYO21_06121 [Fonsecaea monophora]|uniref:Carboxylic ester hydrolase n=1 Tax=Fonsecaea monophora TaxID=254056 RepID=A0A177F618_9EURO|nr:hypothetical protein AYO21_06121 [Fonsecaea monophora]OAG39653.1 hypothetical protein AYO21_06121 [Fonsecaea monophora]